MPTFAQAWLSFMYALDRIIYGDPMYMLSSSGKSFLQRVQSRIKRERFIAFCGWSAHVLNQSYGTDKQFWFELRKKMKIKPTAGKWVISDQHIMFLLERYVDELKQQLKSV